MKTTGRFARHFYQEASMSRISVFSKPVRVAASMVAGFLWYFAAYAQDVTYFPVPDSMFMPTGITVGPDGAMWFADPFGQIGRIDASGAISGFSAQSQPSKIALGPDGNLWFTDWSANIVSRMTPSGVVSQFAIPTASASVTAIAAGPDGNVWFTESGPNPNQIGRITPAGVITEFTVPTTSAKLAGLTAGPDGNVWFTEADGNKIGRITSSGDVTEFDVPTPNAAPVGIAAGPDGNLWFTENARNAPRVGRITPSGQFMEFRVSGGSDAVLAGPDGGMWFLGLDAIMRRVATSGAVTEYPSGLSPRPNDFSFSPEGSLWFTIGDGFFYAGRIARMTLDTSACVADANTLCLDSGRFRVKADWAAQDGSTGHGRGVNLTANSGYFWFFDAANVEMVVKVLDGCSTNQHHWAFAAGLTNVEVTTTVTDTYSGLVKSYTNAQGKPFAPIQDTAAFATCQ